MIEPYFKQYCWYCGDELTQNNEFTYPRFALQCANHAPLNIIFVMNEISLTNSMDLILTTIYFPSEVAIYMWYKYDFKTTLLCGNDKHYFTQDIRNLTPEQLSNKFLPLLPFL